MQSLEGEGDGFWRNELEASVAGVQWEKGREGLEKERREKKVERGRESHLVL